MKKKKKNFSIYFVFAIVLICLVGSMYFLSTNSKQPLIQDQQIINPLNTTVENKNPTKVDYLQKITIKNPTKDVMRLEKNLDKVELIQEYRPKGQYKDFPAITITKWNVNERPLPNSEFQEILIDGKPAKHYVNEKILFLESPPLVIEYVTNYGQVYYPPDMIQSLFNAISID